MIFGINTTNDNYFKVVSNFTRLTAREITYNNFEISLVVSIPNITTNHSITYTNHSLNSVFPNGHPVPNCQSNLCQIWYIRCIHHYNIFIRYIISVYFNCYQSELTFGRGSLLHFGNFLWFNSNRHLVEEF